MDFFVIFNDKISVLSSLPLALMNDYFTSVYLTSLIDSILLMSSSLIQKSLSDVRTNRAA